MALRPQGYPWFAFDQKAYSQAKFEYRQYLFACTVLRLGQRCAPFVTRPPQKSAMPAIDAGDRQVSENQDFVQPVHETFPMKMILQAVLAAASLSVCSTWAADATVEAASKEPGALVTPSGLVYRSLKDGTGDSPKASDKVKVNYRGTFPDGKEFDSSYKRNQAIEFPLSNVIKCWTEGVQRMKVGGKAKLTCPAAIAYGERGAGGVIPPNATLLFEVELLGINGK